MINCNSFNNIFFSSYINIIVATLSLTTIYITLFSKYTKFVRFILATLGIVGLVSLAFFIMAGSAKCLGVLGTLSLVCSLNALILPHIRNNIIAICCKPKPHPPKPPKPPQPCYSSSSNSSTSFTCPKTRC